MLEQAITEIQNIERSVARKTLSDLQIRLALRSCLKELRVVRRVPPAAREQLGHQSPPGSSSLEIKRLPVGQRQLVEIHDGETEEKSGQGLEGRGDPRPQTPAPSCPLARLIKRPALVPVIFFRQGNSRLRLSANRKL